MWPLLRPACRIDLDLIAAPLAGPRALFDHQPPLAESRQGVADVLAEGRNHGAVDLLGVAFGVWPARRAISW